MKTLKDWQRKRTFLMKGAIKATRERLQNLITVDRKWLTPTEEIGICSVIAHLDFIIRSYDKNTKKLRP